MIKLFGLGGKKEERPPKLGRGFVPTDRVRELSDKGFSEPEMIDVLRKEGFSAEEIDKALTQALKVGVSGEPREPPRPSGLPTMEDIRGREERREPRMPEMPGRSIEYPAYPEEYGTEELVESIVHERMGEVDQRLAEFRTKYADLERRISNLHHQLSVLSKGRSQAERKILSKLDSYKDSLEDMNARLSSFERAFKEALPALIESVRSLTDLVQRIKKES